MTIAGLFIVGMLVVSALMFVLARAAAPFVTALFKFRLLIWDDHWTRMLSGRMARLGTRSSPGTRRVPGHFYCWARSSLLYAPPHQQMELTDGEG